jgi:hypothetical protein
MNAPADIRDGRLADTKRLRVIRSSLEAIAPADWTRVHGEAGAYIESRGEMAELFVLLRFDEATPDEIAFVCDAPDTVAFLLRLLEDAFDTIRALKGEPARRNPAKGPSQASAVKNFSAECAIKCQEPAFLAYLEKRHGLERPLTEDRAAQKVRSLLGVTSRKELNDGGRASDAWKALRADFATWLKAER